jgi:hypothetical protein
MSADSGIYSVNLEHHRREARATYRRTAQNYEALHDKASPYACAVYELLELHGQACAVYDSAPDELSARR